MRTVKDAINSIINIGVGSLEVNVENNMNEHEFEVVEMMSKYGGSFVKSLAECFHRADPINFKKLKAAFPEYWKQYEQMYVESSNSRLA